MLEKMLAHQPQDYAVLYIDMDSFFASAEQQRTPALRGLPVGVSPYGGEAGCVVAASREAKRFGVRTGMRGGEARRLAPAIKFVRDTPHYYRLLHGELLKILEESVCRVTVRGIDEMRLDIPTYMRTESAIYNLVSTIKYQMRLRLGEYVTASFGVAANQWQAKLAASSQKPNGFVVLQQIDREVFYTQLPLLACTGINYRFRRQLFRAGIYNTSGLYQSSEPFLRRQFGINGTKWYLRLRGYEVDDQPPKEKQSLGHQTTLMPKSAETYDELRSVLSKMALKVGYRLRSSNRVTRGLAVSLSYEAVGGWSQMFRHLAPFSSQASFIHHIDQLVSPLASSFQPVKRATIVCFDLLHQGQQSMFDDRGEERSVRLSSALDTIRQRFGSQALQLGSTLSEDLFPDRIGFGAPESLFVPGADT